MKSTPRFICLVGVDGCGKSSLAKRLQQELATRGIRSRIIWLRMNYKLTRPVLLYCRLAGLTRRPVINGQKISIHEFQNAPFVATLVQYLHWLDTVLVYFIKAYLPMHLRGETIICDRFVYDVLVDFIVESSNPDLHNRIIRRLLLYLLPKHAQVFLIQADYKVIVNRKPDVLTMDPYFSNRYYEYSLLDQKYKLLVICNNDTIEHGVERILEILN